MTPGVNKNDIFCWCTPLFSYNRLRWTYKFSLMKMKCTLHEMYMKCTEKAKSSKMDTITEFIMPETPPSTSF